MSNDRSTNLCPGPLSRLVRAVLSTPTEAESTYIGLLLQAVFGVHLLGCDPDTLRARQDIFSNTLFILDANTLIPYLAKGATGNDAAQYLVHTLHRLQCPVATLTSLAEEVAEHARWALARVDPQSGRVTVETLKAALGRVGDRSNGFLEGLLTMVAKGESGLDLWAYLDQILGHTSPAGSCSVQRVRTALRARAVECRDFNEWEGFESAIYGDRDEVQEQIRRRREQRGSFRHDRQVRAEAEALLLIKYLRNGRLQFSTGELRGAFFVSNTRVIDDVGGSATPITMRPDAILQWVTTLQPFEVGQLRVLTSALLSELATRDYSIVDYSQLQFVFSPMVTATRDQFKGESDRHQALVGRQLGEDPDTAFRDEDALTIPIAFDSANAQIAKLALASLEQTEDELRRLRGQVSLTDRERERLARLEQQERERRRRSQRRTRSLASRPKRRRRR